MTPTVETSAASLPRSDRQREPSVADLRARLRRGSVTSVGLVESRIARIHACDARLRAVLALSPRALDEARAADRRYAAGSALSPLDGIPVLVKDNIDTAGLATTAGSRRLVGAPPVCDAAVVRRLRAAGAVVLGKANLTEWGNVRSGQGPEGWSGVHGQTRNPYDLRRSPGGSSSGSAAAVSAGLAPLALGTDTNGSIVVPAGLCGVVGIKPEWSLLPSAGVVPITRQQDVVGVLAPRVSDAAACLAVLADAAGPPVVPGELGGRRLGLWRTTAIPDTADGVLSAVAATLRAADGVVVPVDLDRQVDLLPDAFAALWAEFRPDLEEYLATRPGAPGSLDALIEGNRADAEDLALVGQMALEHAARSPVVDRQTAARLRRGVRRAARALIEEALRRHGISAIVAAANAPAWMIDYQRGDPQIIGTSTPAAVAGYPAICVPAGFVDGLPVGVTVFGPARVHDLLPIAAAVEEVLAGRRLPPLRGTFPDSDAP